MMHLTRFITGLWAALRTKLMGNSRNLSCSTGFNQQKIIVNSSQTVSVPFTGVGPDTLLTVSSGQTVRPTARVFVQIGAKLAPAYMSQSATFNSLGKSTAFICSFDSSNNLVIQSNSLDTYSVTIYYRIYKDGRPS